MNKNQYKYQYHDVKVKELKVKVETNRLLKQQQQQNKQHQNKQQQIPPLKKWINEKPAVDNNNNKMKYNDNIKINMNIMNKKNDNNIKVKKKKKFINKKKNNKVFNISKTHNDDIPINIVLKFTDSLELASKNLIRLTNKLKNNIFQSGIIGNNDSYVKSNSNNNSINNSINNNINNSINNIINTSKTESKVNLLYHNNLTKFSNHEEDELDYLVKQRLKKRLIEIMTNKNGNFFANTI